MAHGDFSEYVRDLLEPLGGVALRRMFGGYGAFRDGLMFGILVEDRLYFKTDDVNRGRFEALGSEPFVYSSRGRPVRLSYWQVPEESVEDPEMLLDLARTACDAARRSAEGKATLRKTKR